jgi:uncharacterized protein (TIGR00297 family)
MILFFIYILASIIFVQIFIKNDFISRKILHILISIGVIISSYFLSKEEMIILCAIFTILNFLGMKLKITKYDEKGNFGTILYPLAVLISTIVYYDNKNLYFLTLFPMFFSDPICALIGNKINKNDKTIIGSLTFLFLTFLFSLYFSKNLLFSIVFSIFLTSVEFVSKRGLDNLLIVIFSILIINVKLSPFLSAIFFAFLIAFISLIFNWLDLRAGITTFIIGSFILYSGGFKWVIPLLLFLILGSFLSKLNDKKTKRNLFQVIANGGISFILSILNIFYPNDMLYFAHLCAVSSMCSDTFSTEIGMKFSKKAYLITNFKEVEKGTSGGISLIGFLGGILGSLIISLFHKNWFFIFLIGISGNLIDSIIGALFERKGYLSNNMTNFISSSLSAILGIFLYY